MKKKTLVGLVVAGTIALGGGVVLAQGWGYGGGWGWGHMMGPWNGGNMMGPGYGGYGYMMGPGYGNYCGGNYPGVYGETKPLTEKDTEGILRNYIGTNPNLKVGKIKDKGSFFEGEIVTKDNSLVAKLGVDKDSGWVRQLQ